MSCNDLEILPLQPLEIKDNSDEKFHPHLPSIARNRGTLMLIIGAVASGKTCLLSNLFLSKHFFRGGFQQVYFFSPTVELDDSCRFLKEAFQCFTCYSDDLLNNIIDQQKRFTKDKMPKIAIVADDSSGMLSRRFNNFCTRYRHINSNVFLSIQNFRALSPICRTNANSVVLLNGIVNEKELEKIEEEYSPQYKNTLIYCYKKYAKKKYSFLYLKLRTSPSEMYQNFTRKINWKKEIKNAREWKKHHSLDSDESDFEDEDETQFTMDEDLKKESKNY